MLQSPAIFLYVYIYTVYIYLRTLIYYAAYIYLFLS